MMYLCRCPSEESVFQEPLRIVSTHLTYKNDTPDLFHIIFITYQLTIRGYAVAQLVEALRYKPECRGFDSRWCHWNFPLT
jgi:hypothetical protein